MFERDYNFKGIHANIVTQLTTEIDNESKFKFFDRNVDVFIIAPIVGLLYGRVANRDAVVQFLNHDYGKNCQYYNGREEISNQDFLGIVIDYDENKKQDKPVNPPVITSIRVDTHGIDYGKPKTGEPFDYYSYMMQQYYGGGMAN